MFRAPFAPIIRSTMKLVTVIGMNIESFHGVYELPLVRHF
jgi:hypothetical protein